LHDFEDALGVVLSVFTHPRPVRTELQDRDSTVPGVDSRDSSKHCLLRISYEFFSIEPEALLVSLDVVRLVGRIVIDLDDPGGLTLTGDRFGRSQEESLDLI
jgi:hypothetical protein